MTTVTVELEDLEKLVFATGALKTIEGALDTRKRDPFVQPHLDFTNAHNRLASAMRDAQRGNAGTLIDYNAEVTHDELKLLTKVVEGLCIPIRDKVGEKRDGDTLWESLMCKGCIEFGQLVTGVVWPGGSGVESVKPDPRGYPVRLTARGRALLGRR